MELSLRQSLELAKRIKSNDLNNEYDIIVDSIAGKPKLIIQSKIITIQGGNYGI